MPSAPDDAVLLVVHGTIAELDELPGFLVQIRRGRPPSPELLEEMRHKYASIGRSPLLDETRAQARALAERLGLAVAVGARFGAPPTIADGLDELARAGARRACVLPMAPFSVHVYAEAAREVRTPSHPELVAANAWATNPDLIEACARSIQPHLEGAPAESALLMTAHSLPTRVVAAGDPYESLVREAAAKVAERLGRAHELAFQSQGADGGDWLGPDLPEALARVASSGKRRVVLAPIGFLCEHVETLYDLDVEARGLANRLGLELVRVRTLGTSPGLIRALERVAREAFAAAEAAL